MLGRCKRDKWYEKVELGNITKLSRIYQALLRQIIKKSFRLWQRLGVHITLNHFSQPIPDTRALRKELWLTRSDLVGIEINEQEQIKRLAEFCKFKEEYERLPRKKTRIPYQYYINNEMFGSPDAEILYCMIRYFKPSKILEIGSGYSTCLSAQAILRNKEEDGRRCELIAIDPNPSTMLKAGFPGLSKLISSQVQNVQISEFGRLQANDVLFIDSSHIVKIGSDVQYEFLEILPRVSKGVIIHFHDIFLPAEYPRWWVLKECWFYNEQYLLQAFLSFNPYFEVLWAGTFMHLRYPDKLEEAFSAYRNDERFKSGKRLPSSFWIRRSK